MGLRFHKMHGAGNDFVLIDLRNQPGTIDPPLARALANRRTGIGCDQLLTLHDSERAAVRYEVWNADGSRAEQCGNGVRCIAQYLSSVGQAPAGSCQLEGPVSMVECELTGDGQVRVNMGNPVFGADEIPIRAEKTDGGYRIELDSGPVTVGAVSMGNPHALLVVDDLRDPRIDLLGPQISAHPAFPRGCNAGFAVIDSPATISLRVFERGAGETAACGTGACAAAAILMRNHGLQREVVVKQNGGNLVVSWRSKDAPIFKTGPSIHLYEGNLL